MQKKDLKSLALLGMAGGLLLSSQAINASETSSVSDYGNYIAAGCGKGCGSSRQAQSNKSNKNSEIADGYQPSGSYHSCSQTSDAYYSNQPSGAAGSYSSCNAQSQTAWNQQQQQQQQQPQQNWQQQTGYQQPSQQDWEYQTGYNQPAQSSNAAPQGQTQWQTQPTSDAQNMKKNNQQTGQMQDDQQGGSNVQPAPKRY